ncbi:oxidoreductase C-terminal domain-containing protein, partial [Gordonia sihwensis]
AGLRGEPAAPFVEVPRAWTVQYGVNVQMVGWPTAESEVELDGSIDDADATVRTVVDGELVGAVTIGRAAAARACRSEIAAALVSKV